MIYFSYGYSHVYLQNVDSILFHYEFSLVLIYLFTAICSVRVTHPKREVEAQTQSSEYVQEKSGHRA